LKSPSQPTATPRCARPPNSPRTSILLDVMMPKKSGFEVCEALRADPVPSAVKIVMLTAKGRETEVTKGLALGADAYVTKPFSTKDLVQRIKSLLADPDMGWDRMRAGSFQRFELKQIASLAPACSGCS
jgi:DNA-binding response OmpR family regulator